MTLTEVVKRCMRKIYYPRFKFLTPEEIIEIIQEESILTFSEYFPYKTLWRIDPKTDAVDPVKFPGLYKIEPEDCSYTDIRDVGFIYLNTAYMGSTGAFGGYQKGFGRFAYNSVESLIYHQLAANLASMNQHLMITTEFVQPNMVQIHPKRALTSPAAVELLLNHKMDCSTIPNAYSRLFKELCECDVKIAVLDRYPDFADDGVIGGQEVKTMISKFEDAISKRDSLLELFQAEALNNPDRCDPFYII